MSDKSLKKSAAIPAALIPIIKYVVTESIKEQFALAKGHMKGEQQMGTAIANILLPGIGPKIYKALGGKQLDEGIQRKMEDAVKSVLGGEYGKKVSAYIDQKRQERGGQLTPEDEQEALKTFVPEAEAAVGQQLQLEQPQQQAAAMNKLVAQCIKTGAPIGTLRLAAQSEDYVKIAELAAQYDLDPVLIKEALPFFGPKKTRTMSELRSEIIKDDRLAEEINTRVKNFAKIYQDMVAELGDEAALEKFSAEYSQKVPQGILKMLRSLETGDEASNLIISLAVATALLNPRSTFVTKYYPDIMMITKNLPGGQEANFKPVMLNILKALVGTKYPIWGMAIRGKDTPAASGRPQPEWYPKVKAALKQLQGEVSSKNLGGYVASRLSDSIFESNPSAVGFDVEQTLVENFLKGRVDEALVGFPGGVTPSNAQEYEYRKDVLRDFRSILADMVRSRGEFAGNLASKLMVALHNRQEGATDDVKKELGALAKKWDKGLQPAIDKAYTSALQKMSNMVRGYEEWGMNPQSEVKECNELKAAERKTVRLVIGKQKDIGKPLRKYWKERLNPREKGDFKKTLDTVKRNVKPQPGKKHSPEGLAAWLEHESTGKWPAEGKKKKKEKSKDKPKMKAKAKK